MEQATKQLRLRDLGTLPCVVSLLRLPLAVVFPFVVGMPWVALGVLLAGSLSDVLDGEIARRTGRVTRLGAIVDPVADKLFVITVVVTLLAVARMPAWGALLLATRELGELPLVLWLMGNPTRRAHAASAEAIRWGKNTTVLQLVAITWCVLGVPHRELPLVLVGACGIVAALAYWRRALRASVGVPA
jgi:CDP-diacylglycerol--glycerol-3-phosphate 3-phosphatidyltransferase/cardiolipin synthase